MSGSTPLTIHMAGHGHIDPTWLWRWTEGFEEVRATFRSALERMRETEDFRFTSSSACFYAWVREAEPEMFAEIAQRVAEGRWEIAGGWWVEPDCNIPCGESFVRQGLYGQRFFERHFGRRAAVAFNPDSFGHAVGLPQLLKKLGLTRYVYMRPHPAGERAYPGGTVFWWEGPDGSRVLACNIPLSYNAVGREAVEERIARLPQYPYLNPGQRHVLGFFGVGNHGGGPTKEAIAAIGEAAALGEGPAVRFSTLGEFMDAFEAEPPAEPIPVAQDELQHHARGCYSVHTEIKRLNRRAEQELMAAESWAAAGWLALGHDYPGELFEHAWRLALYNQFHDVLAGTSIERAYEDARDQLGAARHTAAAVSNTVRQKLAAAIDATPEGNTAIIFNSLAWPVRANVTLSNHARLGLGDALHVVDAQGAVVPSQVVQGERVGHKGASFTAEVPALGWSSYYVRSGPADTEPSELKAGQNSLDNAWWRVEFDRKEGHISRLHDKQAGCDVLTAGNVLTVLDDPSDTWSHGAPAYTNELGRFGHAALEVTEDGPVRATLRVRQRWGASFAEQRVTLYRDLPFIDCQFRVNWLEQYRMLKVSYETRLTDTTVAADAAYAMQERPANGEEQPCQMWTDLGGTLDGAPYGLALLNSAQYGYDAEGGALRLSLLRSPAYAHHDPDAFDPYEGWPIIDQGWRRFRVRLLPHSGSWREADVPRAAFEFNRPLEPHLESAHAGTLPAAGGLLKVEAATVLITAVKQSEDGQDLILRGYETAGVACSTRIALGDRTFEIAFAPHELKTLRINPETGPAEETDLLEERL